MNHVYTKGKFKSRGKTVTDGYSINIKCALTQWHKKVNWHFGVFTKEKLM